MLRRLPASWRPPRAPPWTGRLARNRALCAAERWNLSDGHGPEDVVVDHEGRLVAGLEDGRIVRWPAGGGVPRTLAETRGRPLGIELAPDGTLVVCDARRGLLRVDPAGRGDRMTVLCDRVGDEPLRFCNNAAVARDGTIYFSDSSTWTLDRYRMDLLEHRPLGRLLVLRPGAVVAEIVADGLYFANGVALSPDESFLVVVETSRYRVQRLELSGPRAGERHVLVDNLPGFPDNVSTSPAGRFWLAIPNPRNRALDLLLPRPALRWLVAALPDRVQPQPTRYGLVLGLGLDGTIETALHDPGGRVSMVTGAREHDGWLYLGSLTESCCWRVRL